MSYDPSVMCEHYDFPEQCSACEQNGPPVRPTLTLEMTGLTVHDGSPETETPLADVLQDVSQFISRFLILPDGHSLNAITLWVAHCHVIESWDSTPRLALMSPEKRSGKTRVQEVCEPLVPEPLRTSDVTPAVMFRSIGADPRPTVFVDEVDTIWVGKGVNEELRALINAGHRRGNDVLRMVGDGSNMKATRFRTFAAVCLAGIGDLPDTIADRSIQVQMRRRLRTEPVERWRSRVHTDDGHQLRDQLALALQPQGDELAAAYPEIPPEIEDRAADVWEPLLAIADLAGSGWPQLARAACLSMTTGMDTAISTGVRLLSDTQSVWPENATEVATHYLLTLLHELEDGPWGAVEGRDPLTARRLAYLLKPYGVTPHRRDDWRGYRHQDMADPWSRYCDPLSGTVMNRQKRHEPSCSACNEPLDDVLGTGIHVNCEPTS